jgi:hypothetical protein
MTTPPRPAILCVHQIGKVGSTSVLETLKHLLPAEKIHQTHVLHERAVLGSIRQWLGEFRNAQRPRPPRNLLASVELSRRLAAGTHVDDWYLLSLVREPISRNISDFFENLRRVWVHHLAPPARDACLAILKSKDVVPAEKIRPVAAELVLLFQRGYPREMIDAWFEREIHEGFGIDIFARPFSREEGYQIYRRENVRLLVFRLENLATAFAPGIRTWLAGSPWESAIAAGNLSLRRANEAGKKNYAALHAAFLEMLTLDNELVRTEYGSRTARYFYSDDELARFSGGWRRTGIS